MASQAGWVLLPEVLIGETLMVSVGSDELILALMPSCCTARSVSGELIDGVIIATVYMNQTIWSAHAWACWSNPACFELEGAAEGAAIRSGADAELQCKLCSDS